MKILVIFLTFLVMLSACDRNKGKGSDTEWQQRQEEQERQQERKLPPEHSYEYVP